MVVPARGPSSDWLDVLLQLGRDPTALSQEDLRNRNLCKHLYTFQLSGLEVFLPSFN